MSDDLPANFAALPLSLARRVNDVCRQFEAAWQSAAADARPRAEDYLEEAPEPERSALLHELIPLEADYRRLAGEEPQPEEYQRRFPALDAAWLRRVVAVPPTAPEPSATGEPAVPELMSPSRPQSIRCPHCHHPIPQVEEQANTVLCPGCGSSFRVRDVRPAAALPGPRRLGKFQLLERVGAGAFGTVWKAHDTELDRVVALKIPHASLLASPDDLERFYREARAAAQLHHPGIVTVHEVTALEGLPVIVADFVEGVPLRKLLNARRLTFPEAATLVAEVAEAVDDAHAMGLVHRDLKPANIMVEDARPGTNSGDVGKPRVMDFGLALRHEAEVTMTLEGQILGTPAYMSPEQAAGKGHQVDRRSDVYSLGVILYELLCSELPFRGSTTMLVHQVLHDEPQAPRRLNAKIPRDLETICLKAMAKEPGRRYAMASMLAEDLRRFLNGEPIQARPVGPAARLWRWGRRNPKLAVLTGAVAALLVAVAVGATLSAVREQRLRLDAEQAKHQAEQATRQADERLVAQYVAHGMRLMDEGDLFGALPWLAQALQENRGKGASEEMHRDRLAAVLQHCPKLVHLWAHEDQVVHAEFDAAGRRVVTASDDGSARVWDIAAGQCLATLKHAGPVRHAAFSPDGRQVVTASDDGTAQVWAAQSGEANAGHLRHGGEVKSAAFSLDGRWVVTASADRTARLWEAATGKELHTLPHRYPVYQAVFSPDGHLLLTVAKDLPDDAVRSEVVLWDAATGQRRNPQLLGRWDSQIVNHAAFSRDGRYVVTAGHVVASRDGQAQVWETATGTPVTTPLTESRNPLWQAVFSPDGRWLATAGPARAARIWEVATGQPRLIQPLRHSGAVQCICFSLDSRRVLTTSADGTARVWDVDTGQPLSPLLRHGGLIAHAAFHSDGRRVLTVSGDRSARLWDLARGERLTPPLKGHTRSNVNGVAFSPDGRHVVTAGVHHEARVWDASTGEPVTPWLYHNAPVSTAAFSPDGHRVVTAVGLAQRPSIDDTVERFMARVWDTVSGQPQAVLKHRTHVLHAAFSPDGRRIVTASGRWFAPQERYGEAQVWDAVTGASITGVLQHEGAVSHATFSPNGDRLVTASQDGKAQVWDVATRRTIGLPMIHRQEVNHAAFSSDGRRVVTASGAARDRRVASGKEGEARVWDADTGEPVTPVLRHEGTVMRAAFSPDNRRVVTAATDGTARLWDAATGGPLLTLRHGAGVRAAAFSPDGRRLVTASHDKTARVWEADTGQPLTPPLELLDIVMDVALSPDGRRLVTGGRDWRAQVWDLPRDERPALDLVLLAQLLAGYRIDARGRAEPVLAEELQRAWQVLSSKDPNTFGASPVEVAAWHRHQADQCVYQVRWKEAVSHLDRVLAAGLACSQDWYERGRAHAELGQWDRALADYARAVTARPADVDWLAEYDHLCLATGITQEYRRICADLLERFGQTDNVRISVRVSGVCELAPDAVADPSRLVSLVKTWPISPHLGRVLYRAGQFDAALHPLKQLAPADANATLGNVQHVNCQSWLFLAMAHQQRGDPKEARAWLDKAVGFIDADSRVRAAGRGDIHSHVPWQTTLKLQLLRREAEALINGPTPAPNQ